MSNAMKKNYIPNLSGLKISTLGSTGGTSDGFITTLKRRIQGAAVGHTVLELTLTVNKNTTDLRKSIAMQRVI